jgi:P27 family predicted phage terminase small subunit
VIGTLSQGHVTSVDRATLVGYCLKFAQWTALEEEAARHPFIVRGHNNKPMPNPAISLANRTFVIWLRAAAELGITPSSRARIVAAPFTPDTDDEFSKFQARRPRR